MQGQCRFRVHMTVKSQRDRQPSLQNIARLHVRCPGANGSSLSQSFRTSNGRPPHLLYSRTEAGLSPNFFFLLYSSFVSQKAIQFLRNSATGLRVYHIQGWAQGKKKNPEVNIYGDHRGGSGGRSPPEAEENTVFFTLKMQFQGISTHKLLGLSTNATPKLLPKL